jgi:hypothetical protein
VCGWTAAPQEVHFMAVGFLAGMRLGWPSRGHYRGRTECLEPLAAVPLHFTHRNKFLIARSPHEGRGASANHAHRCALGRATLDGSSPQGTP